MFPVECFNVEDPNKIEAVKYYIELNKALLKQLSSKDAENFSDFLKVEGKEILTQMNKSESNQELYSLLAKIDAKLPYAEKIKNYENIENRVQYLHKEIAKLELRADMMSGYDRKTSLKIQRNLAREYDELETVISKYKDALLNLQYIKSVGMNETALTMLYAKNSDLSKGKFLENFKITAEEMKNEVKELRAEAFKRMREYYIKEMVNLLEHEASLRYTER